MNLTKAHRSSLLNALEAVQKEQEINIHCLKKQTTNGDSEWFEAKCFLDNQLIECIKSTLIANEMDF